MRKIISETIDSMVKYRPGSDPKRNLRHGYQQPPIPPELFVDDEYKDKLSSMRKDSKDASRQADELASMLGYDQFFGAPEEGYTTQKSKYDQFDSAKRWKGYQSKAWGDLSRFLDMPLAYDDTLHTYKRITSLSDEEIEATTLYNIVIDFENQPFDRALNALKVYAGDEKYKQERNMLGNKILSYVYDTIEDMEADITVDHEHAKRNFDDED